MKRILAGAMSLGLCLANLNGIVSAQTPAEISTNADGSSVTSRAGINPTSNSGAGTVISGDSTTGPGNRVIGSPTVNTAPDPVDSAPTRDENAVSEDTGYAPEETGASDRSDVATSETNADADNIADSLERDPGLDPGSADTDRYGVADGDEISSYSTDPLIWDTDGEEIYDGEELFGNTIDPLLWDGPDGQPDQTLAQEAAETASEPIRLPQDTTQNVTAVDGDAAILGNGDASASPGTVTRPGGRATADPSHGHVVSDAPSNVTITGDTAVIAPLDESSNANLAPDAGSAYSCQEYSDWYDAQIAYENAGAMAADPALVQALDPDYDGIACEEGMA